MPVAGHAAIARQWVSRSQAERTRPQIPGESADGAFTALYFDGRFQITVRFPDEDLRARAIISHGLALPSPTF